MCLERICCVVDALPLLRLILQQIGQGFEHFTWSLEPTSNTSVCSISDVLHPVLSRLPGWSDSVLHQRVRHRTDEAHVDSETESTVLIICVPSNVGGLPRPFRSLRKSASRGSVLVKRGHNRPSADLRFQRTGSAAMHDLQDDSMTALLFSANSLCEMT